MAEEQRGHVGKDRSLGLSVTGLPVRLEAQGCTLMLCPAMRMETPKEITKKCALAGVLADQEFMWQLHR